MRSGLFKNGASPNRFARSEDRSFVAPESVVAHERYVSAVSREPAGNGSPRGAMATRVDDTALPTALQAMRDAEGTTRIELGELRGDELGQFVARNVACDPNAVSISRTPFGLVSLLGGDIAEFTRSAGRLAIAKLAGSPSEAEKTKLLEDMLQIAVRNNLVGAAGELGLLMTALEGSPNAVTLPDGERALAASDIEAMFAGKKVDGKYDPLTRTLPPGWDTTPRTLTQFLLNTLEILRIAGLENLADTYGTTGCPVTE